MSFFTAGYLELNRLHKAFSTRGQSTAASAQQDDSSPKPAEIPSQHRVSLQPIQEWQPFKDLRQLFANTRRMEHTIVDASRRIAAPAQHPSPMVAVLGGMPHLAGIGGRIDNTETFARNLAARANSGCVGG